MKSPTKITAQLVTDYLLAHLAELRECTPGYITLSFSAMQLGAEKPSLEYKAYSEHLGHSLGCVEPSLAVSWMRQKSGGRSESEILRAKMEELRKQAQELEAQGK